MEVGFVKADSRNLPKVSVDMVWNFFGESAEYSSVEIKGTKLLRSTRESYGDNAIGYVQIKRDGLVQSCKCEDCAASEGGCKHAAALLLWLHRRSEEPPVTSVTCYWKKS
ncbi:hypothetical protein PYW08_006009 [Mythimna loreyi]|uniref:Uncharacterized protein n=1 Tax=Mythimna loreyi TaxID=667449 RepID=A0ACC2QNC4_9NEOP|nr:hypothetical protein PYW08_006009 [Mythimna loreyi]